MYLRVAKKQDTMTNISNSPQEVWKDIQGFEGLYKISSQSVILNMLSHKVLKQTINHEGYCRVALRKNGTNSSHRVHRLVASAFLPNPQNLPLVNHKNEIKHDNMVNNLEWCTHLHNVKEGCKKNRTRDKITKEQLDLMYEMSKTSTLKEIGKHFKFTKTTIHILLSLVHPDY